MKRFLCALVVLAVTPWLMAEEVKNPLYEQWVTEGIKIPDGPTIKLPTPLLKPGQDTKIDEAFLEKAAENRPLELFKKRSPGAPFVLHITSIEKAAQQRCAQMISLRFLAYGKLETVLKTDVLKQLVTGKERANAGAENRNHVLKPEELKKRGIRMLETPDWKERYGTISMTLLDKVQVEGVTRSILTSSPRGIIYAIRMDDRFGNDQDYPNRWRAVLRKNEKDVLGPPQPYTGLGGYVVVTPLPEPKDALLIEMQFLLHEPLEWFGGLNMLRSKLSIPIRDNVQTFRRRLEE